MKLLLAALPIVACACFVFAEAPATQPAATQPTTQPNHLQQASYGIGYSIGKQMKAAPIKLEIDRVIQGLRDALADKPSEVSEQALQAAMMKVQQDAMAAEKAQGEKNVVAGKAFRDENAKKKGVTTTASGLQIETVKEGTGESPKPSDTVKVHYTGTLIDGTKFDSSVDRGQPAMFPVGGVIKGWTEGLQLMKVGGKAHLVIPPEIAYGEDGRPGIPPNATLVFDVELLEIVKK